MPPHKIIVHAPELKLHFTGKTPEELFTNGLSAIADFLEPEEKKPHPHTRLVKIQAENFEQLLVKFLNEVLRLTHTNQEVYRQIGFDLLNHASLKAHLFGYTVLLPHNDIKKARLENTNITSGKKRFEATITLEV